MNFLDLLNKPADEVEKPPLLPVGTYNWKITKQFVESEASQGRWKIITIPVTATGICETTNDVDEDELAAYGPVTVARNSVRFMFDQEDSAEATASNEETLYNMTRFLMDAAKVDVDPGATIKECLAASIGCEFRAQAVHKAGNDRINVNLTGFMPIE